MPPPETAASATPFQRFQCGRAESAGGALLHHDVQRRKPHDGNKKRKNRAVARSRTATCAPATAVSCPSHIRPGHCRPAMAPRSAKLRSRRRHVMARPAAADGARHFARCAAAALAKSSRSCASMVNSRVTPDSACGSLPRRRPPTSRGSSTSMPSTSWRAAIARSGRIQLQFGPRKSLMITAIPRRRSGRRSASMAVAGRRHGPGRRLGHGGDGAQQRLLVLASGACRHPGRGEAVGDQRADPVPPPLLRNVIAAAPAVAFLAADRAEVQAGRQ